MTKPFSIRELLSRIKTQLRRCHGNGTSLHGEESIISVGGIVLNADGYTVFINDKSISLTKKEFDLLKILMENRGKVLKRDFLLERIWGYDTEVDTRTVDVHIRFLRQKMSRILPALALSKRCAV